MASPILLSPFSWEPGTVLGGRYRVVRPLGQGGMGIVVAARHLELHEMVAIKMLLPSAAASPVAVARFTREARATVKIKSPYVARVIDVGKLEGGVPFIVMEYLEGESLAERLRRTGPLPIRQAAEFVVQATHAVAEAHTLGIIHRDLKPANLFVVRHRDGTETIKVLDFGITKLLEATEGSLLETLTQTSTPPGSPPYMAPEQLQDGSQIDYRVDVWALGITLFELLAGIRPFRGRTLTEICLSILDDPLPKLRKLRPEVPAELEAVVERCTAKDRDQRFSDVGALSLSLAPFGHGVTRHTAERAARLAEQSGERAVRCSRPVDSVVPTERLRNQSIPPPPESLIPRFRDSTAAALANQVTHTAASEAVTHTSDAPLAARKDKSRPLLFWAGILGITVATGLGALVTGRQLFTSPLSATRGGPPSNEPRPGRVAPVAAPVPTKPGPGAEERPAPTEAPSSVRPPSESVGITVSGSRPAAGRPRGAATSSRATKGPPPERIPGPSQSAALQTSPLPATQNPYARRPVELITVDGDKPDFRR